jgi:hypothetical protein
MVIGAGAVHAHQGVMQGRARLDAFMKNELLDLASVCEEVADNIEDHQTQTRH